MLVDQLWYSFLLCFMALVVSCFCIRVGCYYKFSFWNCLFIGCSVIKEFKFSLLLILFSVLFPILLFMEPVFCFLFFFFNFFCSTWFSFCCFFFLVFLLIFSFPKTCIHMSHTIGCLVLRCAVIRMCWGFVRFWAEILVVLRNHC